ncbi:hypothetical protein EDB86DRAFT_2837228 [Lactarius hatsudake]|nr:hypothetical protein EDB86DRAFT_2837228 [Lactarius hatsudake]
MIHPTRLLPAGFQLALLLATVPSMSAYYTYPKFIGCINLGAHCLVLNCIRDDSLGSATYTDPAHLTLSSCAYFCWDRNYLWAGVKNGKDCYCIGVKDYPPDDAFVSSDKCNVKCTGDSSENCGGSGYLGFYSDIIIREENRSPDEEGKIT